MTATWQHLLAQNRLQKHETSTRELDDLRAVVDRDLHDAALKGLSDDRRFATAYNAALQLGKMVLACAGYRVTGMHHHRTTIEALALAMGPAIRDLAAYFDLCRRKRNVVDYDRAYVATKAEADELIAKVQEFKKKVAQWVAEKKPQLDRG